MSEQYEILRHARGLVVSGDGVPLSELIPLMTFARSLGFDRVDAALSQLLGVVMVITSADCSEVWRRELGLPAPEGGVR